MSLKMTYIQVATNRSLDKLYCLNILVFYVYYTIITTASLIYD